MVEKVVVSSQDARTVILHDVATRLADMNVDAQLETAVPLLEFLEDIEDKTADDMRKIKEQQKYVDLLSGKSYHDRLRNIFAEKMSTLSDDHLSKYHSELVYEEAIANVNTQIIPELEEVQQELLYGVVSKPTLQ